MSKLKNKKYLGLLLIIALTVGIISLISFGKPDKYSGLIKVKDSSIKTKLLSSTGAILDNNIIAGNSTVEYTVSFTLEEVTGAETRTAIIKGSITDEESRYARFKRIEGTGITSTLSNNGKNIEVQIENVRLGEEKQVKLKLVVENAPNEFTIRPTITVNERTGEETNISVEEVTVNTNSVTGTVTDENSLPVSNIEVVVRKDGREVKRTYTDDDGKYLVSDLEVGTYELDIDEEVYDIVNRESKEVQGNVVVDLSVKAVDPYTIETHKYIESLHLIVDGDVREYTYQDAEKVVEEIKRANTISGEIEYKLVVTNTGEKAGTIARVEDSASEGLKLDESKNVGWEQVDDKYYYRPIEGVSLSPNSSREITLRLDIESTAEAKTYINKMTARGELYERVVFILDGEVYRETDVLAGDTVDEVTIESDKFSGWYTDSNMTNRYKFSLPVTKDLILYGEVEAPDCVVTFMDFGNVYDRQTIKCGSKATKPADPVHEGYRFDKWLDEDDYEFDSNEPVDRDVTYTSKNDLINYDIEYHGLTTEEETTLGNPKKYNIESNTITLVNPSNRVDSDGDPSEAFIGWTTPNNSNPSMTATIPHGSTGKKEFTANWTPIAPDEYTITYDLDGGSLADGVSNPNKYTKYTATFTLNNPSKEGYEFIGWTGTDLEGNTITVTVPTGSRGNRSYVAHYRAIEYTITYHLEGGTLPDGVTNPDKYTIESPEITLNNPSKVGHTFIGWTGSNGNTPQTHTTIPSGSTGDKEYTANYEINKFNVTYMDGDTQFARETVDYGNTATAPNPGPTKEHNIFLGWTLNNQLYDFSTPVTDDITLYSSYEEVIAPTITHTPTEWTNQNVTVTITSSHPEYTYMYKVGNGNYQQYNGPFEVEENTDVLAYSVKQNVNSVEALHEIRNIDKIKPTITALDKTASTYTSITVDLSGYDNESGLKQFNLYINDNLETSFEVTSNPNDPQTRTYTFTGLEPSTSYKISVEAKDIATNVSDKLDKDFETDFLAVARIIGEDNVLWPEEDYIEFGTLRAAIEYRDCVSTQCTIQMLQNVNESNEILDGQDITLDLNGKTVSGVSDYTIRNDGSFTLIDDADTPGMIYNSKDTAIINENGGVLTLGVDEDPIDVHASDPQVVALKTGIYTDNDSTFNYYDGFAQGRVAIQGNVDRTPYLYNADVEVADNIQTSSLKHLTDAEARIKSVYYTKVHDAIEDSKKGTSEEVTETISYLQDVKSPTNYGFTYENGVLTSENAGIDNTTAVGYYQIDMTNETEAKLLSVSYTVSSEENDRAYGVVKTTYGAPSWSASNSDNIFVTSGENSGTATKYLAPGNNYYLYFGYVKNDNTSSGNDNLIITDITFASQGDASPASFVIDNPQKYGFVEQNGQIVSTNTGYTKEIAYSTFDIDLTNETQDKIFSFVPNVSAAATTATGSVYVKKDGGGILYKNTSFKASQTYTPQMVLLEKGYVYRVTLRFRNSNSLNNLVDCQDIFTLSNLSLYNEDSIDLSTFNIDQDNYNYTFEYVANDGSVKANPKSVSEAVVSHVYYEIDLTNETSDQTYLIKGRTYVNTYNNANAYAGLWLTNTADLPVQTSTTGRIVYNNGNYGIDIDNQVTLTAGQKYYLHLVSKSRNRQDTYRINSITKIGSSTPINNITLYDYSEYDTFELNENNELVATLTESYTDINKQAKAFLTFDLTNSPSKLIKISDYSTSVGFYATPVQYSTTQTIYPVVNDYYEKVYLLPGGQVTYINILTPTGSSGTEYRIGKIEEIDTTTDTYNSYEEVKTVARLNEEVDTVEILKDITLANKIDIVKERAVILDLNGYTLSNNVSGYMITNNGDLTLTDNKYESAYNDLIIETEAKKQEMQELYDEYKDKTTTTLDDYVQDDLYIQYDAYYGNNGGSAILADVKGNNNDVSFYGPTYPQLGYMELYAGNFNIANSNRIDMEGSFTVETSFNKRETGNSHTFMSIGGEFGTFGLYVGYDGTFYMYGPSMSDMNFGVIDTNKVQDFTFVYDKEASVVRFYIDGICKGERKFDYDLDTSRTYISYYGTSVPIDMYNVSIYKKALTEQELAQNYYVNMIRYGNRTNLNQSNHTGATDNELMIDGNMETYFEGTASLTQNYTLPNPLKLNKMTIYFDKDYLPASVTLTGNKNGQSNSENIFSKFTADIDSDGKLEVEIPNPTAYVKYTLNVSPNGSDAYRIKEIETDFTGRELEVIVPEMNVDSLDIKKFTTDQRYLVYNAEDAVLNVENVKLENTSSSSSYTVVDNYGTLNVNEQGLISCASCTGVDNHENAYIYFDGGKIEAYTGINNESYVQTTFDNVNIKTSYIAFKQALDKDIEFNNANITATASGKTAINNSNIYVTFNNSNVFGKDTKGSISPKLISHNSFIAANCSYVKLYDDSYLYTSTSGYNNLELYDSTYDNTNSSVDINSNTKFTSINSTWISSYYSNYLNLNISNYSYPETNVIKNSKLNGVCIRASSSNSGVKSGEDLIIEDSTVLCGTSSYDSLYNYGNTTLKGKNYISNINNNTCRLNIEGELTVDKTIKNDSSKQYNSNYGLYVTGNVVFTGSGAYFNNSGYLEFSGNSSIDATQRVSNPAVVQSGSYSEVHFLDNFEVKSSSFSNAVASGKVYLGVKDADVHMSPTLRSYGMTLSTGNIYYYDGTIIGPRNSTYGNILDVEDGYDIKKEYDENDIEYDTLSNEPSSEIAQIGDVKYFTLQDAFNDVPTDGTQTTIEIIGNISTSMKANLSDSQNVIINLNNHTIKTSNYPYITNNGTMVINDTNPTTTSTTNIINYGNLTLNNVKMSSSNSYDTIRNGNATAVLTISNNSNITSVSSRTVESDPQLGQCIYPNVYITDSNVTIINCGRVTMTDSTSNSIASSYLTATTSTITSAESIIGGTITSSTITTLKNIGETVVYTSTLDNVTNSDKLDIHGGTTSKITNSKKYGTNRSELNLYDNATISCDNKCISNYGNVNVYSANITATNTGSIAIVAEETASRINVGTKGDGVVSIVDPVIKGYAYAIQNKEVINQYSGDIDASELNFYDGVLVSSINMVPYDGTIREVETEYSIVYDQDGGDRKAYLDRLPVARVESTGDLYYDIKTAFEAVNTQDDTLTILKNVDIPSSYQSITIEAGNKFTVNFDGHTITHNNDNWLINNADLTLTSNTGYAYIHNYASKDYINNGKLTFDKVNLEYNAPTEATNNNEVVITNSKFLSIDLPYISSLAGAFVSKDADAYNNIYTIKNNNILNISNSITTNVYLNTFANSTTSVTDTEMGCLTAINGICNSNRGTLSFNRVGYTMYGTEQYSWFGYDVHGTILDNSGVFTMNDSTVNMKASTFISGGDNTITGGTYKYITGTGTYNSSNYNGLITGNHTVVNSGTFSGIDFESNDLTLVSGTYNSTKILNMGSLTLGTKDGTVDTSSPYLNNSYYTVIDNENGEIFNFYDGTITGPDHREGSYSEIYNTIVGLVSDIEVGTSIYKEVTGEELTEYLTTNPIVRLSSNNQEYLTLSEAISNANAGDTITYIRDVTYPTSEPTTTVNKDVIIDLDGHTIDSDAVFINNSADITLKNGTLYFYKNVDLVITNTGNMNLQDININKKVRNDGTMSISNGTINHLENNGTVTFVNNTTNNIEKLYNYGTLNGYGIITDNLVTSGTINVTNSELKSVVSNNNASATITDSTVTGTFIDLNATNINGSITVSGTSTIDNFSGILTNQSNNTTITNSNIELNNYGTISVDNTNTVTNLDNNATATLQTNVGTISNEANANLTLDRCTITGTISNAGTIDYDQSTSTKSVTNSGTFNMISGSINAGSDTAFTNTGTLILGTRDGSVDGTAPSINGDIGVTGNVTAFYDGIVTGTTESISGVALVLEDDYELKKDEDQGLHRAYLTQTPEGHARVAVVNNINYTSLQAAIDACANTTCDIILYANIELTEPVAVQEGADISIYLNYRTISPESYITNHTGSGNIRIVSGIPSGLGGAIYKFFANLLGTELNPHNIIVYQMDDGNKLLTEETYKLYKLMDGAYKIVEFNEEEIGEYTVGSDLERMNVTKGRLYLNGLGEGEYKLVSNTNRELDFEITKTGISSNIRINTGSTSGKVTSSSVATLILTFGTGIIRVPYVLILVGITIVIAGLLILKSKKKQNN